MTATERNEIRDRLLRMAERERIEGSGHTRCAVHGEITDGTECRSCFDVLAKVALTQCAGSTLLEHEKVEFFPGVTREEFDRIVAERRAQDGSPDDPAELLLAARLVLESANTRHLPVALDRLRAAVERRAT